MGKTLKLLALLLCMLALAGCGAKTAQVAVPEQEAAPVSKKGEVAVYMDSTLSMLGYANFPTDSEYAVALKSIEQALNVAWKESQVQFFRFGNTTQPLSREEFLQAATPGFYQDTDNKLQSVVAGLKQDKVNIVVTDLFQTDQDMQSIITALNAKFLGDGNMVALLGMSSRFNGTVYDIGNAGLQFSYQSGADPKSYKPFYFLILGPEQDVLHLVQAFEKILPNTVPRKLLVYGDKLGTAGRLTAAKADLPAGQRTYAATSSLLGEQSGYLQYILKDNPGVLLLDFNVTLPYAMKVEQPEFVLDKLEAWQNGKFVNTAAKDFKKTEVLNTTSKDKSLECRVALQLDPAKLPQRGIYRVHVALRPSLANYRQIQQVFKSWNMDVSGMDSWNAGNFPGNTTFNLEKFTNNLAEVAYVSLEPSFDGSWIYFKY